MEKKSLQSMYREITTDYFPSHMELSFFDDAGAKTTLKYKKATWDIDGQRLGLRYGENPDQGAALYRLVQGNLTLGDVTTIEPGRWLVSDTELLQSGKHPGKINLTDVDSALNILRFLPELPACVIIKHNNPCGVARDVTLERAYRAAYMADRLAAFGGAVAVNREIDVPTAEAICESYLEVVAAPSFAEGVLDRFKTKKNLRVMRIAAMSRLEDFAFTTVLDFKSLIDGGCVVQSSFLPVTRKREDFLPAECVKNGETHRVNREPTDAEYDDMLFGWLIEAGVTSNSVLYVKNGVTIGIGTGEQDRVGVAEIARDKAYRKLEDRLCFERHGTPWNQFDDETKKADIREEVASINGGLIGSTMISDAFFPFRDGIDVGLREGVSAVVQPGGSLRDFESIDACNEAGATMKFTGQRSFKH